ncbi:MAG: hypothetical protein ABSA27_04605 [Terriglobales bacterium]|jgi:hypothetical protein
MLNQYIANSEPSVLKLLDLSPEELTACVVAGLCPASTGHSPVTTQI